MGLSHASRDGSYPDSRDQLDAYARLRVYLVQVIDQLCKVLDAVNVVMRRRRDQRNVRRGVAQLRDERRYFGRWKLSALAGLGPLRHLDLQFFGAHKVLGCDAETSRGHLLDLAAHGDATHRFVIPVGVFAALARIVAPADAVHGDGDGLVRLWTQRAKRHGGDDETRANGLDRLNLFHRYRHTRREGQRVAQCGRRALVDQVGELFIIQRAATPGSFLQRAND